MGVLAACSGIGFAAPPIVLDDIREALDLSAGQAAAVTTSFALGLAVCAPVAGRVLDALGTRRMLDLSVVVMVVGAVLAASAGDFLQLVAGRLLQGSGAIGAGVAAFATIPARVRADRTAVAQGVVTATALVILGFGPLIGAGLEAVGSWRLTLMAPLAVLPLLLVVRPMMQSQPPAPTRFDTRGAAYVALAATAFTLVAQGRSINLGLAVIVVVAVIALLATAAVVRHVRRRPDGFVPASFVRDRKSRTIAGVAATCFGAYLVLAGFAPEQLQDSEGWSQLVTGVALLPAAAAAAAAAVVTGRWITRKGAFSALVFLSAFAVLGLGLVAAVPSPTGPMLGAAAGIAAFAGAQVVLTDALPQFVEDADRGAALGIGNLVFLSGGTIGTALAASMSDSIGTTATLALLAIAPVLGMLAAARLVHAS